MKDPIKSYFLDKIQILLINKETLRVMIQERESSKTRERKNSASTEHTEEINSVTSLDSDIQDKEFNNNKPRSSVQDTDQPLNDAFSFQRSKKPRVFYEYVFRLSFYSCPPLAKHYDWEERPWKSPWFCFHCSIRKRKEKRKADDGGFVKRILWIQ